jgi:hypothetical protein
MYPKYMLPLFPPQNAIGVNFEEFGKLSASDNEGFGIDAAAQKIHGFVGVGASGSYDPPNPPF